MKPLLLPLLLLALPLLAPAQQAAPAPENLLQYAHPLVGTRKMGHTYPGATVPFGMVQLSPDTDTLSYALNGRYNPDIYKYCAGYNYDDPTIVGFSHTHFSGTGHSDLGDFLLMPTTGPLQLSPGTADRPQGGFRSAFSHKSEVAEPGYYRVLLDDHRILAELTASPRVGLHQYTFPGQEPAHIILDMMTGIYNYPDKNVWSYVRLENDSLVTGYRQTTGWGRTRTVYFAMQFSKRFKACGAKKFDPKQTYRGFWGRFDQTHNWPEQAGRQLRLHFDFDTAPGEAILVKFALSPVSSAGALANMRAELPGWNFTAARQQTQQLWQQELSRVTIQTPNRADKENFYTALYHASLGPTIYQDVDGQYRGLDQQTHRAEGFTNYTTFSLWDTYRALHPWLNLTQPRRNADMVSSMLAHFDQSAEHMLPVWSHHANENWCMSGYHSVSVIADAVINGAIPRDQAWRALHACVTTARHRWYDGLGEYIDYGYVPEARSGTSVSNTLEFAYDDWCISQLADYIGEAVDDGGPVSTVFRDRANNWQHVFDARTGFMRPRAAPTAAQQGAGAFREKFDVLSTNGQGFIEGNAWNYSLCVPHDPTGLIARMGGPARFVPHLDSLFTMPLPDRFFAETEDITREGIIGGYVHGNEPAHHVAYLYNYAGQPHKTQARVRHILARQYHPTPDGLGGNDDCGQMSAWYLFSALGFYPVAPASGQYALGSPLVHGAVLHLDNGREFIIRVKNQSPTNVYVQRVSLNGQPLTQPVLAQSEVVKGGTLEFVMGARPVRK